MSRSLLVLTAVALAACSSGPNTRQAPAVQPKGGFLHDYSKLQPGGPGRALLVYRAPDANVRGYDKVLLDPVTIWRVPVVGDTVSRADLQRLADLLYGSLMTRLRTYYVMVSTPGPKTLRIRAALTEATPSSTTMDVMSQIGPVSRTAAAAKETQTGTPAWVGAASAELEVLDAETGEQLFAAVDRRVGEKTMNAATKPWADVEDTFRIWSEAVVARLQEEGGPTQEVPWYAQPQR